MTDALHTRIVTVCADLEELIPELRAELPHKKRMGFAAGGTPSKGGSHNPAWNAAVANVLLDVHAGVRELEGVLRYASSGVARVRGGADTGTLAALKGLPALAAGADANAALRAARRLETWAWRARVALGHAEPLQRLPRAPGQPEPLCPNCRYCTLRYRPASGVVVCVNPACRDLDGNRTTGRLEVGAVTGEPQLAWADGMTGTK
jgi:hypothetical protein